MGSCDPGALAGGRVYALKMPEVAAPAPKRPLKESKPRTKAIGPVMEAVPVDMEVLKYKRQQLKRIQEKTGALISEKVGLRNRCTLMIQGTSAIVEQTLEMVEELLDQPLEEDSTFQAATGSSEGPPQPPWRPPPSEPDPLPKRPHPPDPPQAKAPGLATPDMAPTVPAPADCNEYHLPAAGDGGADMNEDWNLPDYWSGKSGSRSKANGPSSVPSQQSGDGYTASRHKEEEGFWEGEYELQPPVLKSTLDTSAAFRPSFVEENYDEDDGFWDGDTWDTPCIKAAATSSGNPPAEACDQLLKKLAQSDSDDSDEGEPENIPGRWRQSKPEPPEEAELAVNNLESSSISHATPSRPHHRRCLYHQSRCHQQHHQRRLRQEKL